jgi:allophanate hydrolase subunit 2
MGSIQVPGGEELICLLRDGVTGGGYATIGTVIGVDIDSLAQMQAPNTVRLVEVDVDKAVAARRARDATLADIYRSAMLS